MTGETVFIGTCVTDQYKGCGFNMPVGYNVADSAVASSESSAYPGVSVAHSGRTVSFSDPAAPTGTTIDYVVYANNN